MFGFAKRILTFLAGTADKQRFGRWKNDLEDALEELEKKHKRKKIAKKEYQEQKAVLESKLKKAKELLKKSEERAEDAQNLKVKI